MSLINQTCWVVGGVGVIGRGIARALLQSGATVIVNSREESRLERISSDLNHPEKLVLVKGSLMPEHVESTVDKVIGFNNVAVHHVVAHGAVRYWTTSKTHRDESYSLDNRRLLSMNAEEFENSSNQLTKMHFSAVKTFLPRLEGLSDHTGAFTSYTFVTGDGGGHMSGKKSSLGELNSYHIWGLSSALRAELQNSKVACREVRVGLPINRSEEERSKEPRERPLSEDIGDICAGVISSGNKMDGGLINLDSQEALENNLIAFNASKDKNIQLPNKWETPGSL